MPTMDQMFVCPQNLCIETLAPNVMLFEGGG